MGYWFINNESPLPDKHTESPPAQMVNGRQLFRLSGYLDGISPRSFFLRVLCIDSEIFPLPFFWLHYLFLMASRIRLTLAWGGACFIKAPAGPVWVVCGWRGARDRLLSSGFTWFNLAWKLQFCCRYTNALFFSLAVFLDVVQLRVSCSLLTVQKDHFPPLLY